MRTAVSILIFIICLNLATGYVMETSQPGTEYVNPSRPETTDYSSHWNATEIAQEWEPQVGGFDFLENVYSMAQFLFRITTYIVAGFPAFVVWLGDNYVTNAEARTVYNAFTAMLIALYMITMTFFVVSFVSGRELE